MENILTTLIKFSRMGKIALVVLYKNACISNTNDMAFISFHRNKHIRTVPAVGFNS
jgi:hypothetical protein